jgi:hypothetical protein
MKGEWRFASKPLEQRGIFIVECAALALGVFWADSHRGTAWQGSGFAVALPIALWAWWRALTHARIIGNTPANRIASTAQGYTRLAGHGQLLEGRQRVFEPGTGLPCLWRRVSYRPHNEPGSGGTGNVVEESDASFLIE